MSSIRDVHGGSLSHVAKIVPRAKIDVDADHFDTAVSETDLNALIMHAVRFVVIKSAMWREATTEQGRGAAPDPAIAASQIRWQGQR